MKLRKNRFVLLAALGGAAYYVYSEAKKNPELVESAKQQWNNVRDQASRIAREVRSEADSFISDVEKTDAWNTAQDTAHDVTREVKDTVQDVQRSVEDTVQDLKDSAQDLARDLE